MYDRNLNSKVTKATVEKRITSFLSTAFLGLFIGVTWLVPDTIDIIGTRTSPSKSLLSGLNTRSIFYPVFALFGLKYAMDLLLTGGRSRKSATGVVFCLTAGYVVLMTCAILAAGEGYNVSRFIFVVPIMLAYTFGIFATAEAGGGACYRTLSRITVWAGSCLAAILIVESFILHDSVYEILMGHNPTLRDVQFDPRKFGSLLVHRATGPFTVPVRAGFALLLPFALILSDIGVYSTHKNLLTLFLLCFVGTGVLATGSLGAIIPALVMVIIYCLLYLWGVKGRSSSKVLALGMVGLACIIMFSPPLASLMKDIIALLSGGQASSTLASHAVRYEYFLTGFEYWLDSSFLIQLAGSGIGWMHYDKLGFLSEVGVNDFGFYMNMLLEIGLIGMIGVTLFFAVWFTSAITRARWTPSLERKTLYFSFGAYVIGLLFSFLSFAHYNMLYVVAIAYSMYNLSMRAPGLPEGKKKIYSEVTIARR